MSDSIAANSMEQPETQEATAPQRQTPNLVVLAVVVVLLGVTYWQTFMQLLENWGLEDSYYSHGYLIPFISAFLIWRERATLAKLPYVFSPLAYLLIAGASALLLLGDFLGFRILGQFSIIPMLAGLVIVFWGYRVLLHIWFPLVFLLFMIPIPSSITQRFALEMKLFAAESAVFMGRAFSLPIVQDGSYLYVAQEQLLVGDVCSGMRSLIALVALGAVMSYISKTRLWARWLLFAVSVPIAIFANAVRILVLCVVAYNWGSETASGKVHDATGIVIFAVAFILLFAFDSLFRRIAGLPDEEDAEK